MKNMLYENRWYDSAMKNRIQKTAGGLLLASTLLISGCAAKADALSQTSAPAEREVVNEILVKSASGKDLSVDLSANEVPESYYEKASRQGTIEKFSYDTNMYGRLGEDRPMEKYAEVYLPYGYDETKQYDIVYMMHGRGGSAERFFGSSEDPRALKDVVDQMIERGEMEPMIFVGLSYYPDNEAVEERGVDMELTRKV
jgi:enterochelin esterase-like enzyme